MVDVSAEIKAVDLVAVVADAGVVLKRGGAGRLVGLCPLHGEKTPSFTVYPSHNTFYCFGCGVGGDAAEFVMKLHGIEFPEALRRLGVENGGRPVREPKVRPRIKDGAGFKKTLIVPVYGRPADVWLERAQKFAGWCHEQLLGNAGQLEWLEARGINESAVIKHRLGWNPGESDDKPQFYRHRKTWGLPDEIKKNGKKKMLWLPRGLVIPLIKNEQVVRLRIRRPDEGGPRYYVVPGSNMDLMISNGDHRCQMVVESELDAVLLDTVAGDLAGYVALGSATAKPDAHTDCLLRQTSYLIVSLDYDAAGVKAMKWWGDNYPRANVWPLPAGKDPADAFQVGVDLREWILAAYPAGWHLQRSYKGRPAKKVPKNEKQALERKLPPQVTELSELMRGAPVSVIVTNDSLKILSPPEWNHKNWDRLGRISQLVYFTPDVRDYLHECGRNQITWKNF